MDTANLKMHSKFNHCPINLKDVKFKAKQESKNVDKSCVFWSLTEKFLK